jgi:hypothetical protein
LISEIGRTLAARRLPVLVIHIPDRPGLLDPDGARWQKREAEEFARAIGAKFLDGGRLFEGLSTAEIKGLFLPHDGHWNQAGSDQFAEFVARNLDLLLPARRPNAAGSSKAPTSPLETPPDASATLADREWHVNPTPERREIVRNEPFERA